MQEKKKFVELYFNSTVDERQEIVNATLSSAYIKDFSFLCYAMWIVEQQASGNEVEINEEYLSLLEDGKFKFFHVPNKDTLLLATKTQNENARIAFEQKCKEEFGEQDPFTRKKTNVSTQDGEIVNQIEGSENIVAASPSDNDIAETEYTEDKIPSLEDELYALDWSDELLELFHAKERSFSLFSHMMEYDLMESFQVESVASLSKLNIASYVKEDIKDPNFLMILKNRVNVASDFQKVVFDEIPVCCSVFEILMFLTFNDPSQKLFCQSFFDLDNYSTGIKIKRLRKIMFALPYMNVETLELIAKRIPDDASEQLSELDQGLLNFTINSPYISDDTADWMDDLFDEDGDGWNQSDNSNDFRNMLKEAVDDLPEELRQKMMAQPGASSDSFLNIEFDSMEGLTKESITSELIKKLSKLDSDAHEDINSMSDVLYEWYDQSELAGVMTEEQGSMDSAAQAMMQLGRKMVAANLKPKIIFTPEMQNEINELKSEMPNFVEVIDFLITQVKLNLVYNGKMAFTPILLLGDAGLGKTYVAGEIARILSTGFEFIDFGSTSASWLIKGSSPEWKSASNGKILKVMIESPTINPIVLYDEIDKNMSSGKTYPPEVVLYQLFEPNNSKRFEDEYIRVNMDASTVINLCTANAKNNIPQPLLSRMTVFEIKKLNREDTIKLTRKMYKKLAKNFSVFNDELTDSTVDRFKEYTPREIDRALRNLIVQNIKTLPMESILKLRKNKLTLQEYDVEISKVPRLGL